MPCRFSVHRQPCPLLTVMTIRKALVSSRLLFAIAFAGASLASTVLAQSPGRGFLFAPPSGSLTVRAGYAGASARGDLFSFTTGQLTLERNDFSAPTMDVELAVRLKARTALVMTASYASARKGSEFRDFIDQNDAPIEQTTAFQRGPFNVSVRQYLTSPGRSIGRLAWVPARFAPYVALGGGAMWYRFQQTGDFVDFSTNDVFSATLLADGWTPTARAAAGAEITLSPRYAITTDASYLWARARPGGDFSGFGRIDLSGFFTTAGLAVRF